MDNKRARLESAQTDEEDSPASKLPKSSDFKSFTEPELGEIQIAFSKASTDDPILVMRWNPVWLLQAGNIAGISYSFRVY